MNPLPLRSKDGVTYAFACGHCHNVQGGTHRYTLTPPDAEHLEHMRLDAEQCCRCRFCQKQLPDDRGLLSSACEPCQATHDEAEEARFEAGREAREADQKRRREAVLASVALAKNEDAAWRIASMIRTLSEDYYCAGWLCGIEYQLWEIVDPEQPPNEIVACASCGCRARRDKPSCPHCGKTMDATPFGLGTLPDSDIEQLRVLSERAGGWWVWHDGVGEVFVPLRVWTEDLYPQWLKKQAQEDPLP